MDPTPFGPGALHLHRQLCGMGLESYPAPVFKLKVKTKQVSSAPGKPLKISSSDSRAVAVRGSVARQGMARPRGARFGGRSLLRPISYLPRISMGLTIAQLSAR